MACALLGSPGLAASSPLVSWTLTLRAGHDDQVLVEPDRRGVVEAVAEDFGALATQIYLQWDDAGAVDQLSVSGELGGTLYGNDAIGNDTDVRLGVLARRFLASRVLLEASASGWRFRRTNLEDFNVDMLRFAGRTSWAPGRAWALSGGGRYNRLDFVDRFLLPDTSDVSGDGDVVVTPIGPRNEEDDQVDVWGEVLYRIGVGTTVALDATHRWTDSNEAPVRYRGPSVQVRFGKQVARRVDLNAYVGRVWRTFLEPYPVRVAPGEVVLMERSDRAWQFGFGIVRPVAPRVNLYADGYWTEQKSSIQDFAFDQARFSIGIGVSLTGTPGVRLGGEAPSLVYELAPRISAGGVRFLYRDAGADAVFLVGDFNGWDPTRHGLAPIEDGLWEILVPLDPGLWRYAFVVDGEWRRPPDAPRYEDDGFGGENGVLEVQPAAGQDVTGSAAPRPTDVATVPPGPGAFGRR